MPPSYLNLAYREMHAFLHCCASGQCDPQEFDIHVHEHGPDADGLSTRRAITVTRRETGIAKQYQAGTNSNWLPVLLADMKSGHFHVGTVKDGAVGGTPE